MSSSKALLYRGTPADGDVAVYNAATKKWETQAPTGGPGGGVASVVAGDNVTVDNTDPANPVVSANSGASGPDVPTVQYLEWTWDGTPEQSVVFPAGTLLLFAIVTVHEEFVPLLNATFDLGTTDDATAFVNGANPQAVDVLVTNSDFGSGSPGPTGFNFGMPYSTDNVTFFETETTVVGTLDPDSSPSGKLRFYFAACVPSAA